MKARVHEALAWVGLNSRDFADRPWYALSGGEAQRVALASRLILKPDVLLLDEPTANVDAMSAQLIKDAALKARQEWGTTLIIASHDWQWLHEVADSTLHLFKGRFLGPGRKTSSSAPGRRWVTEGGAKHWRTINACGYRNRRQQRCGTEGIRVLLRVTGHSTPPPCHGVRHHHPPGPGE